MSQPFADRFDAEVAKGFIRANDRLTGLPQYLGLRIVDVGPGTLRAEMAVREDLLTPFKTMHGGVISAVCDHVLGCVCYPLMARGQWAATTEFKLNLLAPVTQGVLAAQATVCRCRRRSPWCGSRSRTKNASSHSRREPSPSATPRAEPRLIIVFSLLRCGTLSSSRRRSSKAVQAASGRKDWRARELRSSRECRCSRSSCCAQVPS